MNYIPNRVDVYEKKTLFRIFDALELYSAFSFCFLVDLVLELTRGIRIQSHILMTFLTPFFKYQLQINILSTLIVAIFFYQMTQQKKEEMYCKILVGDTAVRMSVRFCIHSFVVLVLSYLPFYLVRAFAGLPVRKNNYLLFLFAAYIVLSAGQICRTNKRR